MKNVILLLMLFISTSIYAAPSDFIPPGHQYGGGDSDFPNGSTQLQGQLQGQSVVINNGVGVNATNTLSAADQQAISRVTADGIRDTYSEYVAAAIAPPLVATGDCLGSASAGGSNSVMGFAIGKTYVDENCNARMDSVHLWSMGLKHEAMLRLCSQPRLAKVLGKRCPEEPQVATTTDKPAGW